MRRISRKIVAVIAFVAPAVNADTMDLWQAVQFGQMHDESVQIALKGVEERRLQKRRSLSPLLPQISLQGSANHSEDAFLRSRKSSVNLTQTIWNAEQHSFYAVSKKNLELAGIENLKAIAANIANVTESYLNVLSSASSVKITRGNVAGVEAHKKVVETLFSIHESTILDLTETAADLDLAKVSVITAENELANSRERLIVLVGDKPYELTPVIPDLDITQEAPDRPLNEWLEIARQKNYDLRISRVRLDIAEINIKQAKQNFFPSVALSASWSNTHASGGAVSGSDRQATLSVDIPITQGGGKLAKLQETHIAHERQKLRITRQSKQLRQQVTNLYRNRQSFRERIHALRSLVASHRKRLNATQDGFSRGDRTSNEVLDAKNILVQSAIDLINAIHDYILSGLQLGQLAGTLSLDDIKTVNQLYFTSS